MPNRAYWSFAFHDVFLYWTERSPWELHFYQSGFIIYLVFYIFFCIKPKYCPGVYIYANVEFINHLRIISYLIFPDWVWVDGNFGNCRLIIMCYLYRRSFFVGLYMISRLFFYRTRTLVWKLLYYEFRSDFRFYVNHIPHT